MSLRLRYILVLATLLAAFALISYREIRGDLEVRYREAVEENMVDQARTLAQLVTAGLDTATLDRALDTLAASRYQARIYDYLKTQTHTFVYIVDSTGHVVYHSKDPAEIGADYSTWRDVHLTLQGQYGARSTRTNYRDDNSSILYVAAPLQKNGHIVGALTLAKPVRDFHNFLASARTHILLWFGGATLLLFIAAILAGHWVHAPHKRVQNDLAAKEYIENYVQTLTHELKSPLSSILGATEILEDRPPPDTHAHFLANIRSETQRLRDLVHAILDVAALERRRRLETPVPIDWPTLFADLAASLEVPLLRAQVTVEWPATRTLPTLRGDTLLLRQALHNLLLNAIEYSPRDTRIDFHMRPTDDRLVGTIRDFGPGIPPYALARLGEKFYSLPKPATGRKGTGLGLSLAREVLRLHHGTLQLGNAQPGPGALARFEIPIEL